MPNLRCMERLIKTIRKTTEANAPATSETIKAKKRSLPTHGTCQEAHDKKNNHSQDNTIDAKKTSFSFHALSGVFPAPF